MSAWWDATSRPRKPCSPPATRRSTVVGDLDRVARIVSLMGYVNCVRGYERLDPIIDGASALLQTLFGDHGTHTRSVVANGGLPSNVSVEIELVVEVR
jgi:enamine deaminase RidA (YjgF/YER057c/UK114 family)